MALLIFQCGRHQQREDLVEEWASSELSRLIGDLTQGSLQGKEGNVHETAFLSRGRNKVLFFSREPNCIFKIYLKVLCIETSTSLGSLQKFEGAQENFLAPLNFKPCYHKILYSMFILDI